MLFLSARMDADAVNSAPKILRYITLSPLQPGKQSNSVLSTDHRVFDSFQSAFEQLESRVLVLGSSGSGKTTTLLQFAYHAAQECLKDPNQPIPLFASIHRWDHKTSLMQWMQAPILSEFPGITLQSQSLLYILDGLDELGGELPVDPEKPDGKKYDPRLMFLEAVEVQLSEGQVIVSCREDDYQQIGKKAALRGAVTLLPLVPKQVEEYLQARNQPHVWQTLMSDTDLLELVCTPLLLALLSSAIGEETGNLRLQAKILSDSAIFDFYIRKRFEHEAVKRTLPFGEDITRSILGKIGVDMLVKNWPPSTEVSMLEAKRIVGKKWESFINFACAMSFLRKGSSDTFQFIHLKFRDYCAVPNLIEMLCNGNAESRMNAIGFLENIGSPAVPALIEMLKDEDAGVRWNVVEVLGRMGNPIAASSLVEALKDEDARVRWNIVWALGEIGDAIVVPALLEALGKETVGVKRNIAWVLGNLRDSIAVPRLIKLLKDKDVGVRWHTVEALGRINSFMAISALSEAFVDEDAGVRWNIVQVLSQMGGSTVVPILTEALKDKDRDIRRSAAQTLRDYTI